MRFLVSKRQGVSHNYTHTYIVNDTLIQPKKSIQRVNKRCSFINEGRGIVTRYAITVTISSNMYYCIFSLTHLYIPYHILYVLTGPHSLYVTRVQHTLYIVHTLSRVDVLFVITLCKLTRLPSTIYLYS